LSFLLYIILPVTIDLLMLHTDAAAIYREESKKGQGEGDYKERS
jgi:hypothetical protein